MLALTPFHETLLLFLVPGVVVGVVFAARGGRTARLSLALVMLACSVVFVWSALVMGVGYGYEAWQSGPEPPEEAFRDGGPTLGALFLGWIPASVVCVPVFAIRRRSSRGARDAAASALATGGVPQGGDSE